MYDKIHYNKKKRYDTLKALNDFRKLLGDINWLRPALDIPTSSLKYLFETLKGDSALSSPCTLTPQTKKELDIVNIAIQNAQLNRIHCDYPLLFIVVASPEAPTGVLFQEQPTFDITEWLFPHSQEGKTLMTYIALGSNLIMQGRKRTRQLTGFDPPTLPVPFDKAQQQQLWQTCLSWQVALADSVGILDKHPPAHKLLQFISLTSFVGPRVTKATPIPGAPTYFTGCSNNGKGDIIGPDEQETPVTFHTSPQRVELVAVITILVSKHKTPINIVSDSVYVVGMTKSIETTKIKQVNSEELFLFLQPQKAIHSRSFPFLSFFITHSRAHSPLPWKLSG